MTSYIGTARFEGRKAEHGPVLKVTCDYAGTSEAEVRAQAEGDAKYYGIPLAVLQVRAVDLGEVV